MRKVGKKTSLKKRSIKNKALSPFYVVVNQNVLNSVLAGELEYEVFECDDMNHPNLRRNMNLNKLLSNNIGIAIGAPSEVDLELAHDLTDPELTIFLESPNAFYIEKSKKKKFEWSIQCFDRKIGRVGYHTDESVEMFPNLAKSLMEDMGVVRAAAKTALRNPNSDLYAMPTHPGHHAGPNHIGGYCYLPNAAVLGKLLQDSGRKVAILDIDYHGGNGTYDVMHKMPGVEFVSIHAKDDYPDVKMYKHGRELPYGTTWKKYSKCLRRVLKKWKHTDIIVVSLGWDTLDTDPLTHDDVGGGFELSQDDFAKMGTIFGSLPQQILFIQEGGYDIDNIPDTCLKMMTAFTDARALSCR